MLKGMRRHGRPPDRTFADLDIPKAELFFTKLQLGEVRPGRPTHKGGEPKPRKPEECSTADARQGLGPLRNSDKVFRISSSLLRWLKLDAQWAGIGLCDARGRSTTVQGIRAGFNTTLRRNATDPSLRMRLMRHKSTDLGFGTYDKVEIDELRRELERLPVASALRIAAGAEQLTVPVPVPVRSGPTGADGGRCWPDAAPAATLTESANVARVWPSRPDLAALGRSMPERDEERDVIGPAGLEPATRRV